MQPTTIVSPPGVDSRLAVAGRGPELVDEGSDQPLPIALWRRLGPLADVVIDIGAQPGWFSVNAALSNPGARVIAVADSPVTAEVCRRNCESVVPGRVEVLTPDGAAVDAWRPAPSEGAGDEPAPAGHPGPHPTLAALGRLAESDEGLDVGGGPALVRVDAGGDALEVLAGLAGPEGLLGPASQIRLIVALDPQVPDGARSSPEALLGWLRDRGFRTYLIDDRTGRWSFLAPDRGLELAADPDSRAALYCVRGADVVGAAFVLHSGGLGGAERSTVARARTLGEQGSLVHCYVPDQDGGIGGQLEKAGATVSHYPGRWWAGPGASLARSCHGIDGIMADLDAHRVEVVVSVTGVIPIGAVAADLAGLPHVWSLHEYLDHDHGLTLPAARAEVGRFIAEHSALVVANSESVGRHVLGRSPDRVIPPFGAQDSAEIRVVPPRPGTPRVLGCFSALHPGKGIAQLLDALALLVSEGRDLVLDLYGAGSPDWRAEYASRVEALGIDDHVRFRGFVEDPLAAMETVDIVVMPSLREAFGRVPIEAVLVGRPVVYTRGGGMDGFMVDGVTGVACDPGDAVGLATAVARLVDDDGLRQTIQTGARPAIEEYLGKQGASSSWLSLLVEAVALNPSAEWPQRARAEMLLGAATSSVGHARRLTDELDGAREALAGTAQELVGMAQDRDRWRAAAESAREQAEALTADLAASGAQLQRTEEELDRTRAEHDRARAELDWIGGTLRHRATFGWGARVGLKRRGGDRH